MKTTQVTVTQVVEKRTQKSGNTSTTPNKPGTQVVTTRSQKTVTSSTSPNKPGTQVVNTRSQKATISTSGTPSKPAQNLGTSRQQITVSTSGSPNKPGTQVVNQRSHQTVTTTTSNKPGTTQVSQSNNQRSHKPATTYVNPSKNAPQLQAVDKRGQRSSSKPNSNNPSKPNSRAASKPASQAPTKKIEIRKVAYESSDGDKIKEAFELFDSNDGKIDAREVREAMQNIGYDEKNPQFYQVVAELDNSSKNRGGFTFEDFCQTVNNRIPEKETNDDLREIFELFVDDPNSGTTSLESIKRVADELGENYDENELNAMLNKASRAGATLTFEDFVAIMKEKI